VGTKRKGKFEKGENTGWLLPIGIDGSLGSELEFGSPNLQRTLSKAEHLSDGGFVVGGTTSVGDDWHAWLLRLDSAFSVVWEKTVKKTESSGGRAFAYGDTIIFTVAQLSGLTVLGFDRSGAQKWETQLPSDMTQAACLRLDSDGCLLAMYNSASPTIKIGFLKMLENLQILQTIALDGWRQPVDIAIMPNGDLLISGFKKQSKDDKNPKGWLARYRSSLPPSVSTTNGN